MNKKNQIWVSALIYTSIMVLTVIIVLQVGTPLVNKLKNKAIFENVKTNMNEFDNYIQQVISEGPGSQRIFPLEIKDGILKIQNSSIIWELKNKDILDPKTKIDLGNLKISEGNDVCLTINKDNYTLENSILKIVLLRIPKENQTYEYTSNIIKEMYLKQTKTMVNNTLEFLLGNDTNSEYGLAYTEVIPNYNSSSLSEVKYIFHMNTTDSDPNNCDYVYDLVILFDQNSDFITVSIENENIYC